MKLRASIFQSGDRILADSQESLVLPLTSVGAGFGETLRVEIENEALATATEAVLLHLEDAHAIGLALGLLVNHEVPVHIDHVDELLLAGELAIFRDLANHEDNAKGRLRPLSEHLEHADGGHRVRGAIGVEPIIERLQ